ncbi:MAG: molybdopterin-guanine dinucleotide biosynthesis protein B [Methylococcus sp.]|jgi:molybdopterin-guanine dinucleotide biosynthesis protein B|nr:MAG: molybdopterin-guanine dinucleotide biosynthesis protein B [Methylococcus sp.]
MEHAHVPVLGIAAYSGTGKTTLLVRLIPLLTAKGLRIGLIKHSHHHFEVDHSGKDSFRLREAGANPVMLSSKYRRAVLTEHETPAEPMLSEQLSHLDQSGLDLVLVEGFKRETFAKIELHRPSLGKPALYPGDNSIIAVATDAKLAIATEIPVLDLNRPELIARFILADFLSAYD